MYYGKTGGAEVLQIASKLVSFQSISPYSMGSLEYVADLLSAYGFEITWLNRGITKNIIARYTNGVGASFAFAGHVDVVPVGDTKLWQSDPFILTSNQDGYLVGRGISDMKGAIASFIPAALSVISSDKFTGSISLLLTSDEESEAMDGTVVIKDYCLENNLRFDYCIIGEPSSENLLGDIIKVGRRGSITGYITVHGVQGHIAYPELAVNPIHQFALALAQLSVLRVSEKSKFFAASSLQFANINSGVGVTNVIPGELNANFNIRYNDLVDVVELQQKIVSILEQNQLDYSIKWIHSAKPFLSPVSELFDYASNAIQEITKQTVTPSTGGGTSDGRFLCEICDQMLELGLVNQTIHQVNESCLESDLLDLNLIYYRILETIFYVTKTNTFSS